VLARVQRLVTALWTGLAGGAGAGFLARDALGLGQPLVALAWVLGAAIPLVMLGRRRICRNGRCPIACTRDERGQAAAEFTMLVLLAALALGALVAVVPRFDGRSFGGFLAFRIVCTIERDCHSGDSSLITAYGEGDAALVRELAPNLVYERGERQLPVDWRQCRRPACAGAPDEAGLDVHRTHPGERATAFTRVLRRDGRAYIQYWLYYPDSKTTWAGSDELWERAWSHVRELGLVRRIPAYPGAHPDDWEAYVVRLDPDGRDWARASSHRHWQACKEYRCKNRWSPRTGWTRVSRGSHAGHIPLRRDLHERTTTGEGLRLIPLETLDASGYRPLDEGIRPPWQKDAYWDPESGES
jgi:hypothetical protein